MGRKKREFVGDIPIDLDFLARALKAIHDIVKSELGELTEEYYKKTGIKLYKEKLLEWSLGQQT